MKVENFKAFKQAAIDISPSGVTLIAGPNNSGKSAFLSALDVVAGRSVAGTARRAGSAEPAQIAATFELSPLEQETLLKFAGGNSEALLAASIFERVTFEFTEQGSGMQLRRPEGVPDRSRLVKVRRRHRP